MNKNELISLAREKSKDISKKKNSNAYQKTISWFKYLGLLRHRTIEAKRHKVNLSEILIAGELEPRVLELLPALLLRVPDAIHLDLDPMPSDLKKVMEGIKQRAVRCRFRNIEVDQYMRWIDSDIFSLAQRRMNFHKTPRKRDKKTHAIGDIIREGRLKLSLTQEKFADKYNLSLRVIRDLEQGKENASIKNVNEILAVFGRNLSA